MRKYRNHDLAWREGRSWSLMYYVDEEHQRKIEAAYQAFFSENFVSPLAFESLRRMEREVVQWSAELMHAPDDYAGMLTAGGTESIFLAVLAARQRAHKRGIRRPELVLPRTGHPAFTKAADLLGLKVRILPVDNGQCARADLLPQYVNRHTAMMVASAPSYPHGILDPVSDLAAYAKKRGIPCHVDACVGGFMLPWVEELGYPLNSWDFRVPGVTSISADLHKFGYAAKGCSVLLYSDSSLMDQQFYVRTDWPGGIYATGGLLGTRPGGTVAAAWASIKGLGREGFLATATSNMKAFADLRQKLIAIPEIEIIGHPCMNILAYRTAQNNPDLFIIADQLEQKGWQVDRQHKPLSIHLTLMQHNQAMVNQYITDLKEALAYAKKHPEASGQGQAAMYGLMARLPGKKLVGNQVRDVMRNWYGATAAKAEREETMSTPGWMAQLNRLLLKLGSWRKN